MGTVGEWYLIQKQSCRANCCYLAGSLVLATVGSHSRFLHIAPLKLSRPLLATTRKSQPITDFHPSIACNRFIPFMVSRGILLEPLPAVSRRGQGTPLDKSPAHRRARCQLHIRSKSGFNILLKDTSTCSSAQPGAGIWTNDLPITSWPALPAELQPHNRFTFFHI